MGDRPIGNMWIDSLIKLRWTVCAEIVVGDKMSAIARQTGIFIDLQTQKPIRIPS